MDAQTSVDLLRVSPRCRAHHADGDARMVKVKPSAARGRRSRTQASRAADTRQALIDATVRLLHRLGYSGTTTERIAEEAGISRGALQYHFSTRFQLMEEVLAAVYADERDAYLRIIHHSDRGNLASDWPELMWEVLSRPAGVAVLEILQASRSDPELASKVVPVQAALDRAGIAVLDRFSDTDEAEQLARLRFFHWAIRGLSISSILTSTSDDVGRSVRFMRDLIKAAVAAGLMTETPRHAPDFQPAPADRDP